MNPGRPARWRQLALLTVAVLALHGMLLRPGVSRLAPPKEAAWRFDTRSIAPEPVAALEPEPVAALEPVPVPVPVQVAQAAPAAVPKPTRPHPVPAASTALPAPARTPWPASITAWPSAVLHYEVAVQARGIALAGTARLDWQQDGEHYEARLELSAPGLRPRVQQSSGGISPAGLVPERFSDRSRSEQATHFDRAAGRIVFSNNQPGADWVAGMQDRLSVVLQVAMLVAAQPARFAVGNEVVIPTATTREANEWLFRVLGEEDLALPGGNVRALKLERRPRREYDQRVELWLAPTQAYAPVRLRLTNADGGWVDQRWSSTDRR